jgi:CheY-like chemotaxis protein/GAF domain-containing protein
MSEQRYRLLIPTNGPSLDQDHVRALRTHFDVLEGDAAGAAIAAPLENDLIIQSPESLAALEKTAQGLITFPPALIETMNSVQRLKWFEERLIAIMRDRLGHDHFEVRLLNPKTSQLELVVVVGIRPLGVGKSLFARAEGQGISGYVATTGRTYLCADAACDPRYTAGIDNARSTLTVPLILEGKVVGVLNIESEQPNAFTHQRIAEAELVATYVAVALHMFNLLVVERFTTRKQTAESLAEEAGQALDDLLKYVTELRGTSELNAPVRAAIERIELAAARVREAAGRCSAGPQSLLGVERAFADTTRDPALEGRIIIVVDDEQTVRELVVNVLSRSGCEVFACQNGAEAQQAIERLSGESRTPSGIISDVKLPDLNGYEIFRMAREKFPNLPVILMTGFGYDPHHSIVRASQEGLQSILFKPFKANQLVEEVTRAVGAGTHV